MKTVLADVTPAMLIACEETFGPVAPLFRSRTEEEAIALGQSPWLVSRAPEKSGSRYTLQVPTVHQEGPYRFFFYSGDRNEPAHVHVERDANRAKFWLSPVRLARSGGFGAAELLRIERLVIERESLFLRAWDEHFTTSE